MTQRLSPFVAICPDCEAVQDLAFMPTPGKGWPHCRDCWGSMNVYQRQAARADGECAPATHKTDSDGFGYVDPPWSRDT